MEEKGIRVAFVDGQVLMWTKGKYFDDAVVIGEQEGGLQIEGPTRTRFGSWLARTK